MASDSESIEIQSQRQHLDYPMAETQRSANPDAAELARARIAQLPYMNVLPHPEQVLGAPTGSLITDRDPNLHAGSFRLMTPPAIRERKLPKAARPLLTSIGVFLLLLLVLKSPILFSQFKYAAAGNTAPISAPVSAVVPAEATITIPKINVHAPVLYEPTVNEGAIQKALQSGVVHYGNTALPGQPGNAAIFGHSSNDWWEPGNFKFVFVLLDKLAPGDQITMDYESHRYTYVVTGSRVVEATDLSVLAQTPEPTISLITCTPPGTSWKRLVVTAKQIDPNPTGSRVAAKTSSAAPASSEAALPSSAPGFITQLSQAWQGVYHGITSLFGIDGGPSTASPNSTPNSLPAIK